jgi:hypothetical protein
VNQYKFNLRIKAMNLENIKDKIVIIRGQQTILDSDVAMLYGVETKRVNEACQ